MTDEKAFYQESKILVLVMIYLNRRLNKIIRRGSSFGKGCFC